MRVPFSFATSCLLIAGAALSLASQATADSVQTLNNPVPNGYITIDGNIDDWLSVGLYNQDNIGDGSSGAARPLDIDILQGGIAHDQDFIYVLWRNTGDNMIDPASNWVFFDLDRNPATGSRNALPSLAQLSIGYEFNLGGTVGWNAFDPAGAFVGSATGKVVATGDTNGSGGADFLEWRVSRSAAQPNGLTFGPIGGTQFHVAYVVEDNVGDFYPNNAGVDWFTYDAAGVYDFGVPGDADASGTVDINDYLLIRANSFTRVQLGQLGDIDDNGYVDFDDFHEWKSNFPGGAAAAEAAIAALGAPEPTTMALWGMGLALSLLVERRRRRSRRTACAG